LNFTFKRLLFIGAHPDDVEIGCGGLISKINRGNNHVHYMVLSPCNDEASQKNILSELRDATRKLGISPKNLFVHHLSRRVLREQSDKVRRALIDIRNTVKPDLVFCPSLHDVHQDHEIVAEETFRLFRDYSVICYEGSRSALNFQPNMYVALSEKHLQAKIDALMCYKSQFDRYYFKPNVVKSIAMFRGAQARLPYAEAYEVLRIRD